MSNNVPPIYIVSGGSGDSGAQVVETVLVQFPDFQVPIIKADYVRQKEEIKDVVAQASTTNGTIIHTLVDGILRNFLIQIAKENNVEAIDLMGSLFERLTKILARKPKEEPGLYRILHQSYFDRVDAIEFTMDHDDGKNSQDLHQADIVIIGVSRSGKTPLSMYLAVLGWKVANIPIIIDSILPAELFEIDHRRVFGLNIDYERLEIHRKERQERLSMGQSPYTDPKMVFEELETAIKIFRGNQFSSIKVSDKAIESSAGDIIDKINSRFGDKAKNSRIKK
ncbi:MAG: kinase/pyrophosphorylase [candidate division Zixibacteria bacterium]|nr:kinase/pyrophosphorylase [candidate division Zixibacteria bacterium]